MEKIKKFSKSNQRENGMRSLVDEFRSRFRIKENLNNYSEDTFREAERKFVKFSLNGQLM